MAVVTAWRTGPATLLAAGAGWFGGGEDASLIRPVRWGGFRLTAKELAFPQAELGADVVEFGLKFRETSASALMHGLPVTGLLAQGERIKLRPNYWEVLDLDKGTTLRFS